MMCNLHMPISFAEESVQTIAPGGVESDIRRSEASVVHRTGY